MALGLGRLGRQAAHVATVGVTLWQIGRMGHAFRILNVFTIGGDRFSGNPLCVFEDAARPHRRRDAGAGPAAQPVGDDLRPGPGGAPTPTSGSSRPGFEMPFAGHPTLGTASVVGALLAAPSP